MHETSDRLIATTRASPDWPYGGARSQRPYRLELRGDELVVREIDGTEYGIPLGRLSRLRIGVYDADGWRARYAEVSRLYPSFRFWIGETTKSPAMRFYAYDHDPTFRTFMRALAAQVLREHRFAVVETGEDDMRTYLMAALGVLFAVAAPGFFAQGITTGAAYSFTGAVMCGLVAAMSWLETFRRWPRRAETMKVIDAALLTGEGRRE